MNHLPVIYIAVLTGIILAAGVESLNPFGILKTCIVDSNCKNHDEFCDHTGVNPIGSCRTGYENGAKCTFSRHCRSKNCYGSKCVARKPVKDGPCSKDQHNECVETQYCSSRDKVFKCRDRSYSGVCSKSEHCLSNKCLFFKCRRPKNTGPAQLKASDTDDENSTLSQEVD